MSLPKRMFPEINQDTIAALCAVGRQLAMRLDELIDVSKKAQGMVPGVPGITIPGVPPGRAPEWIELMRMLLASFPRDHAAVTVGSTPEPLLQNTSSRPIPVMITNGDEAQVLYWGGATVIVGLSPTIGPQGSMKILVPESTTLYGVVKDGDIQVGVSSLHIPRMW